VKSLVNETYRPENYNIIWKGDNEIGKKVSSGIYLIRLAIDEQVITSKAVLMNKFVRRKMPGVQMGVRYKYKERNMKKSLIMLIGLLLIGVLQGTTITVDIEGTGDYTSIQEGINASADGDTVLVYPGRYFEILT